MAVKDWTGEYIDQRGFTYEVEWLRQEKVWGVVVHDKDYEYTLRMTPESFQNYHKQFFLEPV